ncbi:MAG: glycoside hydrolase family 97 catalytic domain-containing protein [Cyclobacteriaceae bacterium]
MKIIQQLPFLFLAVFFLAYEQTYEYQSSGVSVKLISTPEYKNGALAYIVKKNDQVVIDTAQLGIVIDGKKLGVSSSFKEKGKSEIDLDFSTQGVKDVSSYKAELIEFEIEEEGGRIWVLELQVGEQGVAYRYRVPGEGKRTINKELTSFKLPDNTKVWFFERNNDWKLKSHAGEWVSADISEMPEVSSRGPVQGLTLTCELESGGYALIAESGLFNYSGTRLEAIGNNTFVSNFEEGEEGFELQGEIVTPWRCILLADDLNALVNNVMVPALSPAPDPDLFASTKWIKPGKSVWHWWSGKFASFEAEKKMVDHAAELGFEYTLADEGWELWENKWERVKKLTDYGASKGVSTFFWKRSSEINIPENDYAVMGAFLDSVKMYGGVGVKVDFMNGQRKSLINFDEAVLKKCAERQLMTNFHGCQQSSGEYRTYPNEVTREGIRGVEVNGMREGMLTASHNAALPFTRYITGHGDYTPIAFTNPGETTWAHQLATMVCFYSPFQCVAEGTDFLLKSEDIQPAMNFIKAVPSVWDETIVLPQSKIGELALMARRKSDLWFVGALNNDEERMVKIDCSFLSEGTYEIEILSDDTETDRIDITGWHPRQYFPEYNQVVPFKKETKTLKSGELLQLDLAKYGGATVRFLKK